MRRLLLPLLFVAACSSTRTEERPRTTTAPLTLGFVPAAVDRPARGAPAIAVANDGKVLVLDAVNGRVVRVENGGELVRIADVPPDADDLAVGPDGAIAVRRSVKPEVIVFDSAGKRVGVVDTSAVGDVDGIALAASKRVLVVSPFQETFSFGSPSMPQLPAAILATKREGAVLLADGRGVVAVRRDDGQLELRAGDAIVALGEGEAARIVGASGDLVCARIEHVKSDAEGAIRTAREAACADMKSGAVVLRHELPAPGGWLPRRELAFAGQTLAFAHAGDHGLEITTWAVQR